MGRNKILLLFLIFALGFIVLLLLGVGFLTLYERHLLGVVANRVGPNKRRGIIPILDGVKLLSKGKEELVLREYFLYVSIPILGFSLMLLEYLLLPTIPLSLKMGFLLFSFLVGSFVYVVMLVGVFSSRKYSLLGRIRSSARVIRYEVCFLVFLFRILTLEKRIVIEGR
jgi:NADH-quinone oxidoreductase subunit H